MTDNIFKVKNGLQVSNTLLYANAGQIGINTSTPGANLDVVGTANVSGAVYIGTALGISGNTFTANSTVTNTVSLVVSSNTATIGTAAYHVSNGNFGLANSSPVDKLSINGTTYFGANVKIAAGISVIDSTGSGGTNGQMLTSNGVGNVYWSSSANNALNLGGVAAASYALLAGPTFTGTVTTANTLTIGTAAYYVSNGNFGVATATPAYKIDVTGDIRASANVIGTNLVGALTAAQVNTAINSASITVSSINATSFSIASGYVTASATGLVSRTGSGNYGIRIYPGGGTDTTSSILQFTDYTQTNQLGSIYANNTSMTIAGTTSGSPLLLLTNSTVVMTLASNGNVGIANSVPVDKLAVNGTSYLNGNNYIGGNQTRTGRLVEGIPQYFASATGTITVDLSTGSNFSYILTGPVTFVFSNPPSSGNFQSFTIICRQDSTGSRAITWPSTVRWSYSQTPVITTTPNYADVFTFLTHNGGSIYGGAYSMANTAI